MASRMHLFLVLAWLVKTMASCGTLPGRCNPPRLNETVDTQIATVVDSDEEVEGPPTPQVDNEFILLSARARLLAGVDQLWEDGQEDLVYMMENSLAVRMEQPGLPPLHLCQAHAVLARYGQGLSTSPLPPAWERWLETLLDEWEEQLPLPDVDNA